MSTREVMPEMGSNSETRSMQDEESFIVIGRSTLPNDASLSHVLNGPTAINNAASPQMSTAGSAPPSSIMLSDLSPDEIQNKLQALLQENVELKEALRQNNLAMKRQFDTLAMWQEEVFRVHQNHKQKFEETKELVFKLRFENSELRKIVADLESSQSSSTGPDLGKLQSENALLKRKVSEAETKEKVVCLKEFQLKKEIADLKEQLKNQRRKLDKSKECANSPDNVSSKQQSKANAAVKAEKEELGGNENLNHLGLTLPSGKGKVGSFVMVEEGSRRGGPLPHMGEPQQGAQKTGDSSRQLEKLALEEERKAEEEERHRAMHAQEMKAEEHRRKKVELEKERLEKRVAVLVADLQREKESGKEMMKVLEERLKERAPQSYGNWELIGSTGDGGGMAMKACESRLGLIREYIFSQEKKNIKIEVWLQKLHQIIVSLMALDPDKGRELKEEVMNLKKQITDDADELQQQRAHLLEAEGLLGDLKMECDTNKAKAESVSSVIKENAESDYHKAQARGYRQKLDAVTARLAQAEESLGSSRVEVVNLAERIRKAEIELEDVPILKAQVEVYQVDFNTEREERERMAAEKQQLTEEVHRLRARNQQLLENLERSGGVSPGTYNTLPAPGRGTQPPFGNETPGLQAPEIIGDIPTGETSEPTIFSCPMCKGVFMDIGPLEMHVNECLDAP